jgi:hypothetical protein
MNQPMIADRRRLVTAATGNQKAASDVRAGTVMITTAALPNRTTAIIMESNVAM